MDTTIRSGAVDAPSAKAAARNVKQRLAALGHEISLNHAYEAVAAGFGHPTWAVMKARLESGTATPPQPVAAATVKPFTPGKIGWDRFALSNGNPTSLFFGPPGDRRAAIMRRLGDEWLTSQRETHVPAFLRVISFKPRKARDAVEVPSAAGGGHRKQPTRIAVSMKSSDISIFDLPLGQRYPSPEHRLRIIAFVTAAVVSFADLGHPSDKIIAALAEPIPRIVDLAYDLRVKDAPHPYTKDVLPELDGIAASSRYGFHDKPATWWQVSDALLGHYLSEFAVRAQAQAVPTMNDLVFTCRYADMGGLMPGGTRVTDLIAQALSRQMREMAGQRTPRRPPLPGGGSEVIEIEEACDERANRLLMLTALNRYRMLAELAVSNDATRNRYKPERLPQEDSPIRLLVSLPEAPIHCDAELKQVFDHAVSAGREVAVFTGDREAVQRLIDISSSYFVHGCMSHAQVAAVSDLFGLEKAEADLVHDHMVGDGLSAESGVPMLAFRRKFHMTERSAVLMAQARQ